MRKSLWIPAGAIAIAIAATAAFYYGTSGDAPPVTGSVQNFIVADDPVPVPQTPIIAPDGSEVSLDRYRGRLVVLNFWATWCGPCIRELPSLQRLSEQLADDEAVVMLLSQDRGGFERITPFLAKLDIEIEDSFVDNRLGFSRAAAVQALPTTIIIDAEGRERGRVTGSAEWDSPEARALIAYYLRD